MCDVPPEYCHVDRKDFTECVTWLKSTHPELYNKIYDKEQCKEWLQKQSPAMFAKLFPDDEGASGSTTEEQKQP